MAAANRSRRLMAVGACAALAALLAPSIGATPTAAQETPIVRVDPTSGTTADAFDAAGTGCENGFVTYRFDDGSADGSFLATDDTGDWFQAINFPEPVGPHTVTFDCSDPSTVGSPTTIDGPGDLRFSYDPVDIETLDGVPGTDPVDPCIGGGDGSGDGTGGGSTDPGTEVTSTEVTVVDGFAPAETTDTNDTTDTTDTTATTDTTDTTDVTETTVPDPGECVAEAFPATAESGSPTYTG